MRDFMNNVVGETETEGRIISTANGGEAMVFEIPFGIFKLVAIANIPPDGEESSKVYLKMKVNDQTFRRGQIAQNRQMNKRRNFAPNNDNGDSDSEGELVEQVG